MCVFGLCACVWRVRNRVYRVVVIAALIDYVLFVCGKLFVVDLWGLRSWFVFGFYFSFFSLINAVFLYFFFFSLLKGWEKCMSVIWIYIGCLIYNIPFAIPKKSYCLIVE